MRSYPGALLAAVVRALGRKDAALLVGSSQGAAAVFNAALELPTLAGALAVVHPVGHDVARYTAIQAQTLLVFDVDDDGHPVSVGRKMRRYLPHNRYVEYSSRRDGPWLEAHLANELHALLGSVRRQAGQRRLKMPLLTRLAGYACMENYIYI